MAGSLTFYDENYKGDIEGEEVIAILGEKRLEKGARLLQCQWDSNNVSWEIYSNVKKDWKHLVEEFTGKKQINRMKKCFQHTFFEPVKSCEIDHNNYTVGAGYKEVDQSIYCSEKGTGNYLYGVQCNLCSVSFIEHHCDGHYCVPSKKIQ